MGNDVQETGEVSAEPGSHRKMLSSRAFRIACGSALVVGIAAGGFGIASAASDSSSSPTPAHTGRGWGAGHFAGKAAAAGTVATVGTDSFTVKTHSGSTVTVDVNSSTTYKDRGVTSPTFTDVKMGGRVIVQGTTSSGTVTATSVVIGFGSPASGSHGFGGHGGAGGTPPAAFGTVETLGSDTFTVKTYNGSTVTVDVNSSTTYKDRGVTSPTFTDVKMGGTVIVQGTTSSGTVTATSVVIGFGGPGFGGHGRTGGGFGGHSGFGSYRGYGSHRAQGPTGGATA